jgi:hypothetical protein
MPPAKNTGGVCAAHDVIVNELNLVKGDISDIYSLIRDVTESVAESRTELATLRVSTESGLRNIEKYQVDSNKTTKESLIRIEAALKPRLQIRRQWSAKAVISLVATILGSGGIGAVIISVIGKGIKP